MNKKSFTLFRILIVVAIGIAVGWSVTAGNAIVPIPVVLIGIGLLYFTRSKVKDVLEDERLNTIREKSSRLTFQIFGITAAVAGAVMLALSKNIYPDLASVGFTLIYSVCALLILDYIAYAYFARKY
ncbi:MAG: DUF2178 domain-containing protein [Dehalococcoidia bacterium]